MALRHIGDRFMFYKCFYKAQFGPDGSWRGSFPRMNAFLTIVLPKWQIVGDCGMVGEMTPVHVGVQFLPITIRT